MKIETERLLITDFTHDMAQAVFENSLDEDNRRFVPDEVYENVDEARQTLAFLISQYERTDGPLVYPIIRKQDGSNIGYVQIVPIGYRKWEIGYHIAKDCTGNGYATEAVKAFLPVIANTLGIKEVYGICLSDNMTSKKVLDNCGFEMLFEGIGDYQGEKRKMYRSIWKQNCNMGVK